MAVSARPMRAHGDQSLGPHRRLAASRRRRPARSKAPAAGPEHAACRSCPEPRDREPHRGPRVLCVGPKSTRRPRARTNDGHVEARKIGLTRLPYGLAGHLTSAERRHPDRPKTARREGQLGPRRAQARDDRADLENAQIEIAGCSSLSPQITLKDEPELDETGPLESEVPSLSRLGDILSLGPHRIACGAARDPDLLARLVAADEARIVLTGVTYNVPIRVT